MQKKKYREENYIFACARIHAKETSLLTKDKYERLLSCEDIDSFTKTLSEFGYSVDVNNIEAGIENNLYEAYELIHDMMPNNPIFKGLRLQYDANNIKLAIKCERKPEFDFDELAIKLSNLHPSVIKNAIQKEDYSVFTENIAKAIPLAIETYDKTSNPQYIDLIIDKALYADIKNYASICDYDGFKKYSICKVDALNIITAIRLLRMGKTYEDFSSSFLDGGTIKVEEFDLMSNGEEELIKSLTEKGYVSSIDENMSITNIQKLIDKKVNKDIQNIKSAVFDAGASMGYIFSKEAEAQNIRMIFAAIVSNENRDVTRTRISM